MNDLVNAGYGGEFKRHLDERTKKVAALRTPRKPEPVSPPADHPARAVRLVPWDPAASKVAFSEADWTKDDLRALRDVIDEIVGTPVLE